MTRRRFVLAGTLAAAAVVSLFLLRGVLATVFFAVTVAYVLYPLRLWLGRRGLGPRLAAGASTLVAFLAGLALVAPLAAVLYLRRAELFAFLRQLPPTLSVEVAGFATTVDVAAALASLRAWLADAAVAMARQAPVVALQTFLFALLVYGLLVRPDRLRTAILRPVPADYHDVVLEFHERTRDTLYALYVLQAATAFGTFVVSWLVFWVLGYEPAFVLAALCGILQFIPVVGPSLLVLGLAGLDVINGDVGAAVTIAAVGLVLIGFAPDAVIRPRLARLTTGLPASLYFVGFTGGVLSVGVVGVIAGPLVVALLAEAVQLLAAENEHSRQQTLG